MSPTCTSSSKCVTQRKSMKPFSARTTLLTQARMSSLPPLNKSFSLSSWSLKNNNWKRNIHFACNIWLTPDTCGSFASSIWAKSNHGLPNFASFDSHRKRRILSHQNSWPTPHQRPSEITTLLSTSIPTTPCRSTRKEKSSKTLPWKSQPFSPGERWPYNICSTSTKTSKTNCWKTPLTWLNDHNLWYDWIISPIK